MKECPLVSLVVRSDFFSAPSASPDLLPDAHLPGCTGCGNGVVSCAITSKPTGFIARWKHAELSS
jgi:hypothetical protein